MVKGNDCVFCKIVREKANEDIVYEDENFLAFLDINPVNYGHVLVIPKVHYDMMLDLPDELIGKIFTKSKELMHKVKEATKADFVVLAVVGIDVPHFHIHLVPRHFNDGMANFWPTKKYEENESKKIAERIRRS